MRVSGARSKRDGSSPWHSLLEIEEAQELPSLLGTPQNPSEPAGARLLQQPHRGPASAGPDTRWPRGFPGAVASYAAGRFRPAWLWGSPGRPASGPSLRLAPAMAMGQRLALLSRGMRLGTLGFLFSAIPAPLFAMSGTRTHLRSVNISVLWGIGAWHPLRLFQFWGR